MGWRVPLVWDWSSLKAGESTICQSPPVFQGPRALGSPRSPVPVESSKYWLTSSGVGGIAPIEKRLMHALEGVGERLHVGDFARHQELEGADGAGVVGEMDEAFIDDFGAGFRGDVAAEIDVEFAGDLEIVGGPGVAH